MTQALFGAESAAKLSPGQASHRGLPRGDRQVGSSRVRICARVVGEMVTALWPGCGCTRSPSSTRTPPATRTQAPCTSATLALPPAALACLSFAGLSDRCKTLIHLDTRPDTVSHCWKFSVCFVFLTTAGLCAACSPSVGREGPTAHPSLQGVGPTGNRLPTQHRVIQPQPRALGPCHVLPSGDATGRMLPVLRPPSPGAALCGSPG